MLPMAEHGGGVQLPGPFCPTWSCLRGTLCSRAHHWVGQDPVKYPSWSEAFCPVLLLPYLSLQDHLHKPLVFLTPFPCLLPEGPKWQKLWQVASLSPWCRINLFWFIQGDISVFLGLNSLRGKVRYLTLQGQCSSKSVDWCQSMNYLLLPVHHEMSAEVENNHLETLMGIHRCWNNHDPWTGFLE